MKNKFLFMFMSCLLFFSCKTEKEVNSLVHVTDKQALDSILNTYVQHQHYPFLYARLENWDGEVIYEHGATNTDLYPNVKMTGDTWFRIWSMSKIITISVALDLMEEGIIKMEDAVTKYIPEFENLKVAVTKDGTPLTDLEWNNKDGACPIQYVDLDSVMTVSHLINHKAGFYYALTGFQCIDSLMALQNVATAKNTDEFIQRVAQLPLIQQPGYKYHYGINTTILGMVAERATGKTLKQLIVERVTTPMKIEGLQYDLPNDIALLPTTSGKDSILRRAHNGELDIFGENVPNYKPEHQLYLGGEGMLGTADGYADFARMLLQRGELNGHRFLEEATIQDMTSPHTQLDNPWGYNGYNLWVTSDTLRTLGQGEGGLWTGGGYESTHFWIDVERKYVGVIMSQMSFAKVPNNIGINEAFKGILYEQL